jgi:hypothetical protein
MLGIIRNRSEIELRNGPTWLLRLPLFKVRYRGVSSEGRQLFVGVGSSLMQWYALVDPGSDDPRLLCALAFIHNQRWNYG